MIKSILNFIPYWYFRYLLVTELYMVEKWERMMMHGVMLVIFSIISLVNSKLVLALVATLTRSLFENSLSPTISDIVHEDL